MAGSDYALGQPSLLAKEQGLLLVLSLELPMVHLLVLLFECEWAMPSEALGVP